MPSAATSAHLLVCHGNHVIVAVSAPDICPYLRGLHCHQYWIAKLQAPASK